MKTIREIIDDVFHEKYQDYLKVLREMQDSGKLPREFGGLNQLVLHDKVLATENKLDGVEACLAVYDTLLNSLDEKEQQQVSKKIMENWK